jgi:L-lactate dehydrogenase complex protein LldF
MGETEILMEMRAAENEAERVTTGWKKGLSDAGARYQGARETAMKQFYNPSTARERAAFTRWKAVENLDKYLIEFESNFIRSGGKVIWAQDITDALEEIRSILQKSGSTKFIKSKTRTVSEIGLNSRMEEDGFELLETDTGDVVMNGNEANSHMILPAIHKSAAEISELFFERYGKTTAAEPEKLVAFIREMLRSEFSSAGVGITGCNFIVADPGAIVITENEGNAGLCTALPKIHIVLAGIEKVLPTLSDLELFLPLLSTYGTGQTITAYNHIISGPRQQDETEGPSELYVVLLDNGRSDVLAQEPQRQAMHCIHCGACQFACPVYNAVGPQLFPGPHDAITLPLKQSGEANRMLSWSASLCGSVDAVCPVKIDLSNLILHNRKLFAEDGQSPRSEKLFYFLWKKAMLKRDVMNWKTLKAGKHILAKIHKSPKGLRIMPKAATRSFNDQWREKMNFR